MDRPPFTKDQLAWLKANLPPGPFNRTLGDAVPSDAQPEPQPDPAPNP